MKISAADRTKHYLFLSEILLIPQYIHTFHRNDGIPVSVDGDEKAHDFIRGKGSYEKAVRALKLLDEHGIRHNISFTINQANKHCIDSSNIRAKCPS